MLNIEKYKEEIIDEWLYSGEDSFLDDIKNVARKHGLNTKYCEDIMDWLCDEYKEPLLSDEEKNFIKDLKKWYDFDAIKDNYPYIDLLVKKESGGGLTRYECVHSIPYFKGNPGFEGLEDSDQILHTLAELDL